MARLLQLTQLLVSAESEPLSAYMHSKSDLMQHGLAEPTMEDLILCTCTIYTPELMGDYFSSYWNCLYTQTLKSTK